jgi:hypothetical protein
MSRTWDECTASASRRSARWAATDRGWLYAPAGQPGERMTLGHYLDYGPCDPHYAVDHDGCTVHAVSCVVPASDRPGHASAWCRDVAAARAWIEAQADRALHQEHQETP